MVQCLRCACEVLEGGLEGASHFVVQCVSCAREVLRAARWEPVILWSSAWAVRARCVRAAGWEPGRGPVPGLRAREVREGGPTGEEGTMRRSRTLSSSSGAWWRKEAGGAVRAPAEAQVHGAHWGMAHVDTHTRACNTHNKK